MSITSPTVSRAIRGFFILWLALPLVRATAAQNDAPADTPAEAPAARPKPPKPATQPQKSERSSNASGVDSENAQKALAEDEKQRAQILKSYEQVEKAIASGQGKPYQKQDPKGRLVTVFDVLELGHVYDNTQNGTRFLVGRLKFLNLTDKPVTVRGTDIKLRLQEQLVAQSKPGQVSTNASFSTGDNYISLSDVKREESVTVAAGATGETWVLFYGIDIGVTFPTASIEMSIDNEKRSLNLKDQLLGQLGFQSRRIGPSKALGVFTISGRLNLATLNVLAEEIDKLVAANVSRLVIHWDSDAPNVESNVDYFLFSYASASGRNQNQHHDQRFPILSNALREIHLSCMPGSNYSSDDSKDVTHDNLSDAVAAALWTAMEKLSEEELIQQIEQGDSRVRPAALAAGSSRLSVSRLPMILGYLNDDRQPEMQKAAIHALRHFGTPEAIDALTGIVSRGDEKLRPLALASLTASRYDSARDAIDELIANSTGDTRTALLRELAKAPLPIWSDLFYENAKDPKSPIRVESLQALGRLGHGQLSSLLRQSLYDPQENVRDVSFELILNHRDPELEPLIEKIVLEKLKSWPIDGNVQQYLSQTRNPKAIEPLLELLEKSEKDQGRRQTIIRFLVEIGDDSVAEVLYGMYDDLTGYERSQVLSALQQMQSPRFMEVARKAIKSKDSSEIYAAISNLQLVDDREAERLLIEMFENTTESNYLSNLGYALAQIGSVESEQALRAARKSSNQQRRQVANQSLKNLLQRRPGYQYIYQAQHYLRQKQNKEALEMIEAAIDLDSDLSVAYSLKGNIQLRMEKPQDALASFKKGIEIDEQNGEAQAGILRVELRDQPPEKVLEKLPPLQKKFAGDVDFELQAALAYADAYRIVSAGEPKTEQQALLDAYAKESLYYLSRAVNNGLNDQQLLEGVPELDPLKKHPDFNKAISGGIEERQPADESDVPDPPATSDVPRPTIIRTSGVIMIEPPPLVVE